MDEAASVSGAVNSQITDAVTQTNVKLVAQAPAIAIAQIYQSIAHATGVMVENAVSAQQQQCIINASAATQGAMTLFSQASAAFRPGEPSADGTESGGGIASDAQTTVPAPKALEVHVQETASKLKQLATARSSVSSQILDAVDATQQYTLGAAGAFAYAHRVSIEAFVEGLEKVSAAEYRQQLQAVQIAATSICLDAMLKSPERAEEYAAVLEAIKQLG
ncbi:RebB family R body protein [Lysobacter capsici]|uniref:RebB family R body protein n=1 Tax=Lysobacter capsici TaxID=435897 RepID=UPI00044AE888